MWVGLIQSIEALKRTKSRVRENSLYLSVSWTAVSSCLWTQTNHTVSFPGSTAFQLQIMGLVSLHNHMCQFFIRNSLIYIYIGGTHKTEFIYKNCVFIHTCLNFSHLHSTLHLIQYTYQDIFSLLKTVFEFIDFDIF